MRVELRHGESSVRSSARLRGRHARWAADLWCCIDRGRTGRALRMARIGYFLSSEEHPGSELVRAAGQAEQAGFEASWISDHFHPWLDEQGHSPCVWSVLGGIAQATSTLRVTTAVTAPTVRIHPAVVAQAAATTAELFGAGAEG